MGSCLGKYFHSYLCKYLSSCGKTLDKHADEFVIAIELGDFNAYLTLCGKTFERHVDIFVRYRHTTSRFRSIIVREGICLWINCVDKFARDSHSTW